MFSAVAGSASAKRSGSRYHLNLGSRVNVQMFLCWNDRKYEVCVLSNTTAFISDRWMFVAAKH